MHTFKQDRSLDLLATEPNQVWSNLFTLLLKSFSKIYICVPKMLKPLHAHKKNLELTKGHHNQIIKTIIKKNTTIKTEKQ